MTALDTWHTATVLVGGIGTLAIFSFLIKENPFFRLFEHLFIGIAAGFGLILGIKNFLWPKVLVPVLGLDIVTYPDGSLSHEYDPRLLLYLLPMVFGLFYYFLYSQRYAWLAKLVIGFSLGMSGGLAFKGFFKPDHAPGGQQLQAAGGVRGRGPWPWAAAWRTRSSSSPCWRSCTTSSSPTGTRTGRPRGSPFPAAGS